MAKHLESLQIKNFRMLEDFSVEKLGHVNLIVGKNNSGKSTVLEALRIYAANANQHILTVLAQARGEKYDLQENDDFQEYPFEDFFTGRKISRDFKISIGDVGRVLELRMGFLIEKYIEKNIDGESIQTRRLEISFERNDDSLLEAKETLVVLKNGEIIDRISFRERRPLGLFSKEGKLSLPCSFVPTRAIAMDELAADWDKIVFTDDEDTVKTSLKMIDPDVLDLTFVENKYADTKYSNRLNMSRRVAVVKIKDQSRRVALSSLGDGMTRVFQIALKIFSAKDGFLLIDEFENGLHYSVQEKVWNLIFEMAQRLNIQVFATTHSRDCIQAFSKVASARTDVEGVLFRMGRSAKKSDNGKVIATVFEEDYLNRMVESDMEIR